MTEYVVLLPGNEAAWEQATEQERSATYDRHGEFARLLAERGHKVTGGNELAHSREARTVHRRGQQVVVTDGPYAEAVEQLGGYYCVETDDLEDLLQVCAGLATDDGPVEVRPTVDHSGTA